MKIKRIIALILSALMLSSMLVFTADAVATAGKPRIWACQGSTSFGATDPQNSALKNQYDAENDIIYARVIPNNHSLAPYLAFWNVKCVFDGTDAWSLTVSCLMRPNVAGITPVLVSAQSRKDTAGTVAYNGDEKYTPATDAEGNPIVFSEADVGKWHTVYFRHDGLEMRYYNQYQVCPYGNTAKASAFYTADNSKTVDIAALGEFATDEEALATDLTSYVKAPKIRLYFDAQNGTVATSTEVVRGNILSAKVRFPEKVTAPEGKRFLGWAASADSSEILTDVAVPNVNTTYYAIYEDISYDIIFKDGENETKVTTAHGSIPEAPVLTKTGYTLGWDKEIAVATEAVTYNAVWTANEYDVVFDAGEGSFAEGKTITVKVKFDDVIAAPEEEPVKEGSTFKGWSPEVGILKTEGATFTAVYEEKVYNEEDSYVNVIFAREDGAVPYSNFAKMVIYKDSTKSEIAAEYQLENAQTSGNSAKVKIELADGTYYAQIIKNGYLTYSTEITIKDRAVSVKEIKLVPGDIKDDFDRECGDGIVDVDDFIRVLRGLGNTSSEITAAVDINEDGRINVTDIGFIKANFGKRAS
ncbi:MAG: hypothetical protein E7583_00170 [Ruminococcaceae bacterium]|nr:hypothetical protein [Oscillospiraceae bacterium]